MEVRKGSAKRLWPGLVALGAALALCGASHSADTPDLVYYSGPPPTPGHDISGMWQASSYDPQLKPIDGKPIPFTAEGRKAFAVNKTKMKTEPSKNACLPTGSPRAYVTPWPIMIMMQPNIITIVHEQNRTFRQLRLADTHYDPGPWDPSYGGEAIAKWDGDTLVVDTVNFNDKTWLDDAGTPLTPDLHLVDRWHKSADGKHLTVEFTIEDPKLYTHPWTARRTFDHHPELELSDDWVCGEVHRDVSKIKGIKKLYLPPIGPRPQGRLE